MRSELEVNGARVAWEHEPHEFLTEVLRREGLKGTKRGCESGDCGACAVLLDGEEVPSCLVLAAQAHGHAVETIEGVGSFDAPHPIQEAFLDAGGPKRDPHALDPDGDGFACAWDPRPFRAARGGAPEVVDQYQVIETPGES